MLNFFAIQFSFFQNKNTVFFCDVKKIKLIFAFFKKYVIFAH